MAPGPSPGAGTGERPRAGTLLADFDLIVGAIFRAATGLTSWTEPLQHLADASDAWAVTLGSLDKHTGSARFGYAAGPRASEGHDEYVRTYHRIDPRIADLKQAPVGKWISFDDHFDDAFVATNPYFQEFALRYGSRHLYSVKLMEDEDSTVLLGIHRRAGNPLVDEDEIRTIERICSHFAEGLRVRRAMHNVVARDALGFAVLDRLHQPAILLDRDRNIAFCSERARAILDRGDPLSSRNGVLVCRNAESDVALTLALRELVPLPSDSHRVDSVPEARRTLRLRRAEGVRIVAATLFALRLEEAVTSTIGPTARGLLVIHEPWQFRDIDPDFLVATFGFTPAEARMASCLAAGHSVDEIATQFKVSVSTIRSQLSSAFEKTDTKRQAELVRLLVAASAF